MNWTLTNKQQRMADWAVYFIYAAVACLLIYFFRNWELEDALITMRYARNFALGKGLIYNEGVFVQGFTAPFYTITLGALYWLTRFKVSLPHLGLFVSYASLCTISICVYSFFRFRAQRAIGFLTGGSLFFVRLFWMSAGSEMVFVLALVAFALLCYSRSWMKTAFFFLGLAVFTRMDSMIIVMMVFAYDLLRYRKLRLVEWGLFLLPVVSWLLFSRFYFHAWLPQTLHIKIGQYEAIAKMDPSITTFKKKILFFCDYFPFSPYALFFFLPAAVYLLKKQIWQLQLLILWGILHNIAYFYVLKVPPFYFWYHAYISLAMAILFYAGIYTVIFDVVRFLIEQIRKVNRELLIHQVAGQVVFGVFLLSAVLGYGLHLAIELKPALLLSRHNLPWYHHPAYKHAALWINDHLDKDVRVAAGEIGILGFYCDRVIRDGCNLINSGFAIESCDYEAFVSLGAPNDPNLPSAIRLNYKLAVSIPSEGYPNSNVYVKKDLDIH